MNEKKNGSMDGNRHNNAHDSFTGQGNISPGREGSRRGRRTQTSAHKKQPDIPGGRLIQRPEREPNERRDSSPKQQAVKNSNLKEQRKNVYEAYCGISWIRNGISHKQMPRAYLRTATDRRHDT